MSAFTDRQRERGEALAERAREWFERARERGGVVDLVADLHERDKDAQASVLGSAIALRLFLFVVPANVALMGLIGILRLKSFVQDDIGASATTGAISEALIDASWLSSWWLLLSGLTLSLMAGRSLAKVLAACARGAWQMPVREATVKPIAVVALSLVLIADLATSIVFDRLRDAGGLPVAVASWIAVSLTTTMTWFLVMSALPRKFHDPGALLPGVLVMGAGYTLVQWFMQFYLPNRVARTTDTFGDLAITVATLGNFFFIGRLMSASFVVTAIVYERWGSISQVVFALPGLRKVAARSSRLRAFFSLDPADDALVPSSSGSSSSGSNSSGSSSSGSSSPVPSSSEPSVGL
jgi:hypothetical protein